MIFLAIFFALILRARTLAANTIPIRGQADDQARPEPDDEKFWSVTTIIGALDKPALIAWAAKATAKAAVDNETVWKSRLANEGRDSAIDYLKGARYRIGPGLVGSTDLGDIVHRLMQEWALTGTRPLVTEALHPKAHDGKRLSKTDVTTIKRMLDAVDRDFLQPFGPTYQATELAVFNRTYGYAGTSDAFLSIDGVRFIVDYKTSREPYMDDGSPRPIYPETALQLAGYRGAEIAAVWRARRFENLRRRYYLLSKTEADMGVPVPEVDAGLGIIITPEFAHVHPVRCDEAVHDAFLYVIEAARWHFELSKDVIGPAMDPPRLTDTSDPFAGLPKEA